MAARKRDYTLYAPFRGGRLTNLSERGRVTPYVSYEVRAVSIRQAYYLAGQEQFAASPRDVGVRKIEADWWHRKGAPDAGDRIVAPYIARRERHEDEARRAADEAERKAMELEAEAEYV